MNIVIIKPETKDAQQIVDVTIKAAQLVEAADMEEGAFQMFCDFNNLENTTQRLEDNNLVYWAAQIENQIVGVIVLSKPKKLQHLFVDPDYHGHGIASGLWKTFLNYCLTTEQEEIIVNASSYALEVYRKWGFTESAPEDKRMGIRCFPMVKRLPNPSSINND